MLNDQEQFHELSFYTLAHPNAAYFIHQHVVDAYAAQMADEQTKSIKITFALVGLCLFIERGFTGREIQLAHMKMTQKKQLWPTFDLPVNRGNISISDVLRAEEGAKRDDQIKEWCRSIWDTYEQNHHIVRDLIASYFI